MLLGRIDLLYRPALIAAALAFSASASAQTYPDRAMRAVVPLSLIHI